MRIYQRITIIRSRKPIKRDINEELQWFGSSLGLFGQRDKDRSCFRIFIEVLKGVKKDHLFTSDELAKSLNLTRGTIIHHLNKMMDLGLIVHEGNKYALRVEKLEILIEEMKKDFDRTLNDIKEIAKDIDSRLGL